MSEAQRLARIQLCGDHYFSKSEIDSSPSPNFLKCKNGCPLEWGEVKDGVTPFKFKIEVRLED